MGFALGAVGGCILGATEEPVDRTLSALTSQSALTPVMEDVSNVGALGLGSLLGATALTAAMTSAVAGVVLAVAVASVFASTRSCGLSHTHSAGLWTSAGLAAAFGTTLSGATLGMAIEYIVKQSGMLGLLWALSIFTMLKPPLHYVFKLLWKDGQACCTLGAAARAREQSQMEITEFQQRERVAEQIEQRILELEMGGSADGTNHVSTWITERQQRDELNRKKMEAEEAAVDQRTIQDWINIVVVKHVDILAFSGMPMAVVAMVTAGLGAFGYGYHQLALIVLLALVSILSYLLLKSSDIKFWMLIGFMGTIATFVIAVLTLHAGQLVVTAAMKMRTAGQNQSRESISTRMNHQSALEALNAAFFVTKMCQLALGASVGGPMVRRAAGGGKVTVGAALVAGALLAGVEVLSPVLGEGGRAGALLGVVGAAGASVGAAAVGVGRWRRWGALAGLVVGASVVGKWHIVNIGLQIPIAYMFAMTNLL